MGSMLFTNMAALAQMKHEITSESTTDAIRLIESGEPTTQVTRDLGISRATFYRRKQTLALPGPLRNTPKGQPTPPPS